MRNEFRFEKIRPLVFLLCTKNQNAPRRILGRVMGGSQDHGHTQCLPEGILGLAGWQHGERERGERERERGSLFPPGPILFFLLPPILHLFQHILIPLFLLLLLLPLSSPSCSSSSSRPAPSFHPPPPVGVPGQACTYKRTALSRTPPTISCARLGSESRRLGLGDQGGNATRMLEGVASF